MYSISSIGSVQYKLICLFLCSLSSRQRTGLLEAWHAGTEFQDQRGEAETEHASASLCLCKEKMHERRPLNFLMRSTSQHYYLISDSNRILVQFF